MPKNQKGQSASDLKRLGTSGNNVLRPSTGMGRKPKKKATPLEEAYAKSVDISDFVDSEYSK